MEQIHELVVHRSRIRTARVDRFRSAMPNVVADQFASHRSKRLLDGGELPQHIGAIAIPFNHLVNPADLTLDTPEPRKVRGLNFWINRDRLSIALILARRRDSLSVAFRHVLLRNIRMKWSE